MDVLTGDVYKRQVWRAGNDFYLRTGGKQSRPQENFYSRAGRARRASGFRDFDRRLRGRRIRDRLEGSVAVSYTHLI